MLRALLKDIRGIGEVMNNIGDETLDKKMSFEVYTRRYSHKDAYSIKRTVDGWYVSHISINGGCNKNGVGALFDNLKHDCVFFPKDGVEFALETIWSLAEEGSLTIEEM